MHKVFLTWQELGMLICLFLSYIGINICVCLQSTNNQLGKRADLLYLIAKVK